jgi:hypothetical protein
MREAILDDQDDSNHRTFVNLVTAAFMVVLAIVAVVVIKWFLDSEKLQRCVLSGRRDCVPIEAPPRS